MITDFEEYTAPLNDIELHAAQIIARCLNISHIGKEKAVTAQHICNSLAQYDMEFRDAKGRPYLNGARIRKIVNHLRMTGTCPTLLASSKGYYISTNREEIAGYIDGLIARASAINGVAAAMQSRLV